MLIMYVISRDRSEKVALPARAVWLLFCASTAFHQKILRVAPAV